MKLHQQLQDAFTVDLIMTPREQLYCVAEGESPAPDANYDLVPITESTSDTIVGLWVRRDETYERVPLSEKWLVSSGTSIRHLIQLFTLSEPPHSMLVVDGGMIVGIVSRADLGKVASRAYLYTLLAEVEYLLTHIIRRDIGDWGAFKLLRPSRQRKVITFYEEQKKRNEETNLVECMHLADLIEIARKSKQLWATIAECIGSVRGLGNIEVVRNVVAHPNREPLVEPIVEAVPIAERLVGCLSRLMATGMA